MILAAPRVRRDGTGHADAGRRSRNARMSAPAIELRGINKHFGPVHANRDINLSIRRGTIHGIVGENGAGKSTLMSILYGFYIADSGDILVNGQKVAITDSSHALEARHRHGAPAFHAGRQFHRARKRRARRRGFAAARPAP
jgi:ABC-type branched-subunit amino acid transport system ATPase component